MSKTFEFPTNPNGDVRLYRKKSITLNPGVTVLVGCNGSGKTTLLKLLKDALSKENIPYINFDNLNDGGSNARSRASFYNDLTFLATSICSSEGENIIMNIGQQAQKIGNFIRKNSESKELWILLDAVDSGLSIDNVCDVKDFFNCILEDPNNKDRDIYIVVSANEYELAANEKCFDVYTGNYVSFKDYEDFKKFILKSREQKNKRKYKE